MKQAFIVCGAECTGNRLMAGLLVSAGCWGRGSNKQPAMAEIPNPFPESLVVIAHFRSDLLKWGKLFEWTHSMHVIVMVRDPWVQALSRAKASGQSKIDCRRRYQSDYQDSFTFIRESGCPFTLVPYEALLQSGSPARILSLFDLKQEKPLMVMGEETTIRNENLKWFKEQP